jgi:hypothetical protein
MPIFWNPKQAQPMHLSQTPTYQPPPSHKHHQPITSHPQQVGHFQAADNPHHLFEWGGGNPSWCTAVINGLPSSLGLPNNLYENY